MIWSSFGWSFRGRLIRFLVSFRADRPGVRVENGRGQRRTCFAVPYPHHLRRPKVRPVALRHEIHANAMILGQYPTRKVLFEPTRGSVARRVGLGTCAATPLTRYTFWPFTQRSGKPYEFAGLISWSILLLLSLDLSWLESCWSF